MWYKCLIVHQQNFKCCSLCMLCCVFSWQYGIVLYQNYKIPQQRKTLLSHFTAPVVSVTVPHWSHCFSCATPLFIALTLCGSCAAAFHIHVFTYLCLPLAECVREFPRGNGFLREDRQGDWQPCGSSECCHGGGTRMEGETAPCYLRPIHTVKFTL